jgi:DNA-binding transcriptional LysR family regulator
MTQSVLPTDSSTADGLDLRSLRFLARLLETVSVTRAGEACRLSQPAASRVLARLREILGDPLLVKGRQGQHVLTARAESLRPAVARAEAALDRVFGQERFDPAEARRVFNVGATEYAMTVLAPDLMRRVQGQAPHCTLHFHPPGSGTLTRWRMSAEFARKTKICFWPRVNPGDPFHYRKLYRRASVGVVLQLILWRARPGRRGLQYSTHNQFYHFHIFTSSRWPCRAAS